MASTTLDLPIVDLAPLLALPPGAAPTPAVAAEAAAAADALHKYGLVLVRDPRASEEANDAFLDMMEAYFEQPEPAKMADVRADVYYQVGTTPSRVELPRNHCERMRAFKDADKPLSLCPPEKDPKWRFFWRVGAPPTVTAFPQLNAPAVVPAAFPQWSAQMDTWGAALLGAAQGVAELSALGFGLARDAFTSIMAGAQAARLTGGHVLAGYHEVVVTDATVAAAAAASAAVPPRSLWRISSTLFAHIASDATLEPLGAFATPEALAAYPPIKAGDHVAAELAAINLGEGSDGAAAR